MSETFKVRFVFPAATARRGFEKLIHVHQSSKSTRIAKAISKNWPNAKSGLIQASETSLYLPLNSHQRTTETVNITSRCLGV